MKSTILFLRGFNSYKTENLRLGPLDLGLAHKYIEPAFRMQKFNFYPIMRIGPGSFEQQVQNAKISILKVLADNNITGPIHFLGHSAGGVWLRAALHHLKEVRPQIKSLVTVTSPHRGSYLAEQALEIKNRKRLLYKSLKLIGYDLDFREHLFKSWTPESVQNINLKYPDIPGIAYGSIVSGAPLKKLSPVFRMINSPFDTKNILSDGIVQIASQPWGQVLGEFELDHGGVLGFRTFLSPSIHRHYRMSFSNIVNLISKYLRESEKKV